jgi:hypothetical protein
MHLMNIWCVGMDWIRHGQDGVQRWALENTVMNLRIYNAGGGGGFFTGCLHSMELVTLYIGHTLILLV